MSRLAVIIKAYNTHPDFQQLQPATFKVANRPLLEYYISALKLINPKRISILVTDPMACQFRQLVSDLSDLYSINVQLEIIVSSSPVLPEDIFDPTLMKYLEHAKSSAEFEHVIVINSAYFAMFDFPKQLNQFMKSGKAVSLLSKQYN